MYKILVIGAVNSTARIITQLIRHEFEIVGVLGYEPDDVKLVSGWYDLRSLSAENNLDFKGYKKINSEDVLEWASEKAPDIVFAVGFSQLISQDWLNLPKLGCVGFHPTRLPIGRGRAPLAWITLEKTFGSATFFLMGQGADDGPIFTQSVFEIIENDNASLVESKMMENIDLALDKWLPELRKGIWNPIPQEEHLATYYGVRKPEDGLINWNDQSYYIDRLVKASSKPHPGAYTFFKDKKVIIWDSNIESDLSIKGVIGRVLLKNLEKGYLIQTGNGLIWINNLECLDGELPNMNVGDKLGYCVEEEIYKIKKILANE